MMETPSHHFRSQHIHSWWFGINTWKKIGQIVETCWNYIKVDPHIFHGFDSTCTLTYSAWRKHIRFVEQLISRHIGNAWKCWVLAGLWKHSQQTLNLLQMAAHASTAMGSFFPSHIQQIVKSPILIIVSRFSNIHWIFLEFALADRCILATQAQPVVSVQAQWLVMCHNVPQQLAVYLK